jgi:PAS domain S-box-containing protein
MNKFKILYVDSDAVYGQTCVHNLIEQGYGVKYVTSLKEALVECTHIAPAIVIFDSELEDGTGFSFIRKIKNLGIECKTILLSKSFSKELMKDAISFKIDAFVSKEEPFSVLNSEIKRLNVFFSERSDSFTDSIFYDLGNNYIYESNTFNIVHHSDKIFLTKQETKLINELIKAKGEFISFEQLQSSIGKEEPVSIDNLRTVIRKIRRKTYNDIIVNKSGHGYRININKNIDINTPIDMSKNNFSNLKVLVVKGDKKVSDQLSYYLEKFGLKCESAYTIDQAQKLLEHTFFDYLITDIDLPDGDGIDLIRKFRNVKNVKFIILSDSSDIHYKEYMYFKGIVDYIINTGCVEYMTQNIYNTIHTIESNNSHNNILVIEKSKKIYEQIRDLLSPRNYRINYLNDLSKAYEIIKDNDYNLVIIDFDLNDSFKFISNVKYNMDYSLPFIMLSDSGRINETARIAYKYGANECLRKPILPEEFILKVDHLVEQSRVINELLEQKNILESYKMIVDETSIVSKTDPNGIITYANDMFCKVSGYSKEELIGHSHNIIRHPDTPQTLFQEMWRTIKDEKNIWHGIIKNRAKNGEEYVVKTYIMPVLNEDDEIEKFIALRIDLTHMKDNKEEIDT